MPRRRRRTRRRPRRGRRLLWAAFAAMAATAILLLPWAAREANDYRIDRRLHSLAPLIDHAAAEADLPPALVRAVVRAESSGDPRAVSHKQAIGLMQITPITLEEMTGRHGVAEGDLFDPAYNLEVGTAYLRYLLDRFDGDLHAALAAYHMGPTRVGRTLADHPGLTGEDLVEHHANPTTRAYVRRVVATYEAATMGRE